MSCTKMSPDKYPEGMIIPLGHFCEERSFPASVCLQTVKPTFDSSKRRQICRVLGTTGIQEERANISLRSELVILGNVLIVNDLLQTTDLDRTSTYGGVLVDHNLKGAKDGRFEKDMDFSVIKKLGQGGFGKVDLCKTLCGQEFVMKTLADKFDRKEVDVLMKLSHPNITAFKGYIYRRGMHEILMEFAGVSLQTFVDSTPTWHCQLTDIVVSNLVKQGLSALEYLHENSIQHLDIKPDNICLLGEDNILKLTDFGSCKMTHQSLSYSGWTPEYMSPEACLSYLASVKPEFVEGMSIFDVTGKSDMFAFAQVIYFMKQGSHEVIDIWKPCLTPDNFTAYRQKFVVYLARNPNYIHEHAAQQLKCSKKLQNLVLNLLQGYPNERPNATEAIKYLADEIMDDEVVPLLVSPTDLLTSQSTCDPPPVTDIWLSKANGSGGGKDIKNSLRQKILRRKSADPYFRVADESSSSPGDTKLPDFSVLL